MGNRDTVKHATGKGIEPPNDQPEHSDGAPGREAEQASDSDRATHGGTGPEEKAQAREDIVTKTRRALWARVFDLGNWVDTKRIGNALVDYEDALRIVPNRRPRRVRATKRKR